MTEDNSYIHTVAGAIARSDMKQTSLGGFAEQEGWDPKDSPLYEERYLPRARAVAALDQVLAEFYINNETGYPALHYLSAQAQERGDETGEFVTHVEPGDTLLEVLTQARNHLDR